MELGSKVNIPGFMKTGPEIQNFGANIHIVTHLVTSHGVWPKNCIHCILITPN
jgi:hypothetical protein